jgi:8-oxo-dGTP diphosphatase
MVVKMSAKQELLLSVNVVIFSLQEDALQVLLTPCRDLGFSAGWQLPGLPVEERESLEQAAMRALSDLVDHHEVYLEQLYTYGDPQRIPDCRQVSVVYFALVPAHARYPSSGAERWFPLDEMPVPAHDHGEILAYALRRLRYKLEYSAVGFQLLPDEFTLSELQHTYEIILGEKLDKRNFRRRILQADIIEETPHLRTGEGRPARLYRYRPDAVAEVKARRLFP